MSEPTSPPPKASPERLFALSDELLCIIGSGGAVLRRNPAWSRQLGYSEEELEALAVVDLLHPEDRERGLASALALEGERRGLLENRLRCKDGSYRWVQWSVVHDAAEGLSYGSGRDITARKTQDERFRVLFEHSSDGQLVLDSARIVDCNPAAVAMLRCADKAQVLGLPPAELSPELQPDGRRSAEKMKELGALARRNGHHRCEWMLRKLDGEELPVEVFLTPVVVGDRSPMLVVWHDLTAHKRAQRALEESEARFRTLCDSSPIGIFSTDEAGFCQYTNARWQRLTGLTLEESLGHGWLRAIHPEDRAAILREWMHALGRGGEFSRELRLLTSLGRVHHVQCRASAVRAGSAGYVGTFEDITERKAAEVDRGRLVAVVEAMPSLVAVVDATGKMTYLNRAGRRMIGAPEDAPVASLAITHAVPAASARRIRDEALPGILGEGAWQGEVALFGEGGREVPTAQTFLAHKGHDGALEFISVIAHDLTELKAVDRMKSEFVSTVSHELRTPLTSISGALRLIEGGVMGAVSPEVMDLVQVASSNCERLIRLINELLDLEKIEAGKLELRLGEVEPEAVVGSAVRGIQGMAEQARVRVTPVLGALPRLTADEDRLIQVLTNLLSNAIKFTPAGSEVSLRAWREGKALRFEVVDQGKGIPADALPRLFGKFEQVDSSDRRQTGGTGLGLAISKAIVEQHGGRIGVESQAGRGSTFWFELPLP